MKNVTCIIKTFERPHICQRLVNSIKAKYPQMKILVADDSKVPQEYKGATTFKMDFDSGLSAGRNLLVNNVETKYFVLLDDDWIFDKDTKIEEFVKIHKTTNVDIIAGVIKGAQHFYGNLRREDHKLFMTGQPYKQGSCFTRCDYTHNFFLAETEVIKNYPWDDELKLSEHLDFFLRVKGNLNVAYTNKVKVSEKQYRKGTYGRFRSRNFFKKAMLKNGITWFKNFKGEIKQFKE